MIFVNGESHELDKETDLYTWVLEKGLDPALIAVELNGAIVNREKYKETIIKAGCSMEIVRFVGGG